MRTCRFVLLGLALLAIPAWSVQEPQAFSFPKTVQGQRAAAYFAAFNSGDEQGMAAFFQEHFAERSLGQIPMPERLRRFRNFKQQAGSFQPQRLLSESAEELKILAKDAQGQLVAMAFAFEAEKPGKILGLRVEMVEEGALQDVSGPPLTGKEAVDAAAAFLDQQTKDDLFSGVALIARGDEVVFQKAYGMASIEYAVPNRLDTRFNLGSINKIFTQIAIEQLAERGKLSLDDPIRRFLPDYPNAEAAAKVTIRHLIDMISGIGDFFGDQNASHRAS